MEENNRINLFDSDIFFDSIAERMDIVDELKNRQPKEKFNDKISFVDKSLFKRVLKDITDIEVQGETLKVYFLRGVTMHIDSAGTSVEEYNQRIVREDYRVLKIIEELVNMGEISLRTSPFVVEMNKDDLRARYHRSLDEEIMGWDAIKNLHDEGINCWGGWGGPVRSNYDSLNMENSLMFMTQRMQQLNIDDFSGDVNRMSALIVNVYKNKPLVINPIILARLVVEYDLDRRVIEDEDYAYFSKDFRSKNLNILLGVKTNIDYSIFVGLVKKIRDTHSGEKTKIKLKRSDT